jgi:hypothetical protein
MNSKPPASRLRIVVAFNVCRRDLESLELAAVLAARRGAEIDAVFVEELNLLNSAELPFTREIDRIFGNDRPFDPLRISRAQRIGLSQIRQELERLAERLKVHGSVRTLRGHFVPTALACVGDIDVLVIGRHRDRPAADRAGARLTVGGRTGTIAADAPREAVWTVFDGSAESSLSAVAVAAEVAAAERRPLFIAVPRSPPDLTQELQRSLASGHEPQPAASRIIEIHPFEPSALLRRLRQSGCRMLVVPRTERGLIEVMTDTADWPLMVV